MNTPHPIDRVLEGVTWLPPILIVPLLLVAVPALLVAAIFFVPVRFWPRHKRGPA